MMAETASDTWNTLKAQAEASVQPGFVLRLWDTGPKSRIYLAVSSGDSSPAVVCEFPNSATESRIRPLATQAFTVTVGPAGGLDADRSAVCVTLRDPQCVDLFSLFAEHIRQGMRDAADVQDAARRVGRCIERWRRFTAKRRRSLSEEEVRGLIGELCVLGLASDAIGGDRALASWLGPDRALRDFECPDSVIEVKTFSSSGGFSIRISDPQQLEGSSAKPLYVAVAHLEAADSQGRTLPEWCEFAAGRFSGSDDVELFWDKLASAGYVSWQSDAYQGRYALSDVTFYLVGDGFPRIQSSDVPPGVRAVEFSVDLSALARFVVPPDRVFSSPAGQEGVGR